MSRIFTVLKVMLPRILISGFKPLIFANDKLLPCPVTRHEKATPLVKLKKVPTKYQFTGPWRTYELFLQWRHYTGAEEQSFRLASILAD